MFEEIKAKLKSLGTEKLAALVLLAIFCTFAAQKQGTITYLRTDPEAAYLTNVQSELDEYGLYLNFTVDDRIPGTANIFVARKQISPEENDWTTQWQFPLMSIPMTEAKYHTTLQYPNATNYNWIVYTDWTPGTTVITNGVWHAQWGNDNNGRGFIIPVNTKVVVDGETVAPPNQTEQEKSNDDVE